MQIQLSLKSDSSFQSTPPRGWRRHHQILVFLPYHISIHSTARVETRAFPSIMTYFWISIHSTARVETITSINGGVDYIISIHSTARVETRTGCGTPSLLNFNPLHREGGDRRRAVLVALFITFQSTPPRGWRLICIRMLFLNLIFQSTPPRGWRLKCVTLHTFFLLFQSTPPRGWRLVRRPYLAILFRFQSTPPRGWRRLLKRQQLMQLNFNPLHREGGDYI